MIQIKLLDGSIREFEEKVNIFQIAKSISNSLAKKAVGAKIDGNPAAMDYVVDGGEVVEIITENTEEGLEIIK